MRRLTRALVLGGCMTAAPLFAAELWVDNTRGDDSAADGTEARPFATPQAALAVLTGGDTLHLVNTGRPYPPPLRIEGATMAGTPQQPTVLEGHGSTVSGLRAYGAAEWQALGDDAFSMPLRNNAHVMDKHWRGFDLVFFDGKAGINCTNRQSLVPFGYYLYKFRPSRPGESYPPDHNTLYVKLPPGRTPDDVKVETVSSVSCVYVGASHVTVRDLRSCWTGMDGFSTGGKAQGIVLERVEAWHCMDQGVSHHGSQVEVRNSHFHHNAGCGIVDVYPECVARYVGCLVEDDTFRGGVEFHKGRYEMEDCIVRNNAGGALVVVNNARVTLRNCVLIGREAQTELAVRVEQGCEFVAERCTFWRFPVILSTSTYREELDPPRITLRHCALFPSETAVKWQQYKTDKLPEVAVEGTVLAEGVAAEAGRTYVSNHWQEAAALVDWSSAKRLNVSLGEAPYSLAAELDAGARLDPNPQVGPP